MRLADKMKLTIFLLLAVSVVTVSAGTLRAPGAGQKMLNTINVLEKTEALMKKTQQEMQSKIDKLNANMADGLDKHIDRTVQKIVKAYHAKEMDEVKKAAYERLRQWASTKRNMSLPDVPANASVVDPSQLIAEENTDDEKRDSSMVENEKVCRADLKRSESMLTKAKQELQSQDQICDILQIRTTARVCLLNIKKGSHQNSIDGLKTKLAGAGWSNDVSPVQMNEWKSSMEEMKKAVLKIDSAIMSYQSLTDACRAKISPDKKEALEQDAESAEEDVDVEEENANSDVSSKAVAAANAAAEAAKRAAASAARRVEEMREKLALSKEQAGRQTNHYAEQSTKKSLSLQQKQFEEEEKRSAAQARNEASAKKAIQSARDEAKAQHKLDIARVSGKSAAEIQKLQQALTAQKIEAAKRSEAQKRDEQLAKSNTQKENDAMEKRFEKEQEEARKMFDKRSEQQEKAMKKQEETNKVERKVMEESLKAKENLLKARITGDKDLLKLAMEKEKMAAKRIQETDKASQLAAKAAMDALAGEKAAREKLEEEAAKDKKHTRELYSEISTLSRKEGEARGKVEILEKFAGPGCKKADDCEQISSANPSAQKLMPSSDGDTNPSTNNPAQKLMPSSDGNMMNKMMTLMMANMNKPAQIIMQPPSIPTTKQTKSAVVQSAPDTDMIQKAVDSAVNRLLDKTKERRSAEEKKDEKDKEEAERVERRRLELEAVNQKADEAARREKAADQKAKDAAADEELTKAQMKKQKDEVKKMKDAQLKQQQMITEMGERAKEKEDRLKDLTSS